MHFPIISLSLISSFIPAIVHANDAPVSRSSCSFEACLSDDDASYIAQGFSQLIGNYSDSLANSLLTPNFTDYSASAISLDAACPQAPGAPPPLNLPLFSNRTQFMMAQGPQPPIDAGIFGVWHGCDTVTARYNFTNLGERPVHAVILFAVEKTINATEPGYTLQIDTTYSEFDSGAWIANLQESGHCNQTTS